MKTTTVQNGWLNDRLAETVKLTALIKFYFLPRNYVCTFLRETERNENVILEFDD